MENIKCTALITASGTGSRMESDTPKQYLEINNKPILAHTIEKFENSNAITHIILVVPKEYKEHTEKEIINKYGYKKVTNMVAGGKTRQESIEKGLSKIKDTDYIMIHDGVRPFITMDEIEKVLEMSINTNGAIMAVAITDTVKKISDDHSIEETIPRENLYAAQTPQCFPCKLIKKAYKNAKENKITATDDASLVEALGEKVTIVEGSPKNIKITTKFDLELARFLMENQPMEIKDKAEPQKAEELITEEKQDLFSDKEPKTVTIYTDGACSGNPGAGGYGAVILYKDKRMEISGAFEETTNNRMEMTAVIEALTLLKASCNVNVYSDSKYVVDAINKGWVFNWQKKNWIKSNKEPALNVDLWLKMLDLIGKHEIKFNWVKGHSDNFENNRCDILATSAIKEKPLLADKGYKSAK